MSFDSTFDYSPLTSLGGNVITEYSLAMITLDQQIADLSSITGHDTIRDSKIAEIQSNKTSNLENIDAFTEILTEIGNVEALSSNNKDCLFNFYTILGNVTETKETYMSRILYNWDALIPEAANIIADVGISQHESEMLGQHLCEMYPIDSRCIGVARLLTMLQSQSL